MRSTSASSACPRSRSPGRSAAAAASGAATGGPALHVGVEPGFRPARKAHVALATRDLDAVARALEAAGRPVSRDAVPGRLFTEDPAGNRTEIVEVP